MYEYEAVVMRVIDGDTVDLKVDLGFRTFKEDRFRLMGINAPDNENPDGKKAATLHLLSLIPLGSNVFIITDKNRTEKYGRWLATIWTPGILASVNRLMINDGHAQLYVGGPRVR